MIFTEVAAKMSAKISTTISTTTISTKISTKIHSLDIYTARLHTTSISVVNDSTHTQHSTGQLPTLDIYEHQG